MTHNSNPQSLIELLHHLKSENTPEKDYYRPVHDLLELKARSQGIPYHGHFELTPLCNLDCKMCYVHLSGNQFDINKLLSVEKWKSLMKSAHKAGMMYASLTGGECLTYPGFDELYLYLWEMGAKISVLSNGILIDDKRTAFFKRYPPHYIQVSLYGSSDDAYEKVTGKRMFSTVIKNLERMHTAKLPVVAAITPNKYMVDDITPLLAQVELLGIPFFINAQLIPPRANTRREAEDFSVEEYIEIFKEEKRVKHLEMYTFDLTELPETNKSGEEQRGVLCGAGRSSFGIRYDGVMCPCFALYDITANPYELGFINAWKEINTQANNYIMPSECNDCVYKKCCLVCPAAHKNAPVSGHCDPRICERTKAMVKAGVRRLPE